MKNNNWQEKKLGNIATFINGKAFKPSDWSDAGLPIIRIQNLTNSIDDIHYYNGDIEEKYRITTGDILISWSATIDVFEWLNGDAVLNQHIFKVVFDKEPIDKTFFKHLIKQKIDEMLKNVHGSTMKHITKGDFDNINVLLPSLDEQKKIAKILDKADEIRAKKKLANDKLDEFLKSTFITMFGDPVRNEKNLKKVCIDYIKASEKNSIVDGPFGSSLKNEDYYESGIPIIRINNIRPCRFYNDEFKYIKESKYEQLIRSKVDYGDVLMARVGNTIGKSCLYDQHKKALLSTTGVCKITCDNTKIINKFLLLQMNMDTYREYIVRQVKGAGQPCLNLTTIKNFNIILPPIEQQRKYVQIVEHVEAQKQKNELVIEQMNNLFNSLSQQAFKGEL